MHCEIQRVKAAIALEADTITSSRFTSEERDAMKNIMDNAVAGANSTYQLNKKYLGNDMARSILQTVSDNLLTVRAMLGE